MKKYRFILGKKTDTSVNVVSNGTFTGSAAGWNLGYHTSYSSNQINFGGAATTGSSVSFEQDKMIRQNGIIIPNEYYYLQYDLKAGSYLGNTGIRMVWSIGGSYANFDEEYDQTLNTSSFTTFTHPYLFAPSGNDLVLWSIDDYIPPGVIINGNGFLDNVILYRYIWNYPLIYDPINWDNIKINKKRDELLNGLIIEYIADVVFINDGYDYIYSRYLQDGFCTEIPARIEIYNSQTGAYELFFEGLIYISDCSFDISKRQVKVNIEDINASLLFQRSKDVKINVFDSYISFPSNGGIPTSTLADIDINFNNDIGVYDSTLRVLDVYLLLKRIIIKASNYRLDADSIFFSSGLFDDFCVGIIAYIGTSILPPVQSKISIKELFEELNKLFDLSFSITENADGIPTIKIEPKINYLDSSPVLILNFVNELEFIFDKTNIVRVVQIGYEHIDSSPSNKFLDIPEGIQYFTDNTCSDKKLDLVSRYIQSSEVLKRWLDSTINTNKYAGNKFWIETDGVNTKNSGSGSYDYNTNIDTEDNMQRWIQTLQAGFLKLGDSTGLTESEAPDIILKTNEILDKIYSFKYPITKAQFDLIVQAYNTIEFNTDGTGITTKQGYLLEANYEIKTGITEFKLLSN